MPALGDEIIKELKKAGNKEFADHHAKFFQTHKGGYGEGDKFFGLKVPQVRETAKKYFNKISLKENETLLQNAVHEVRFCALCILIYKYGKAQEKERAEITQIYLRNTKYINNWDLVDLSCPKILGPQWINGDKNDLWKLAASGFLWEERIAVVTTQYFISKKDFDDIVKLAEYFLNHKHDLMHKAVGWMLREAGKRDEKTLTSFLDKHHKQMPRTMLRYSIERLNETQKRRYMAK